MISAQFLLNLEFPAWSFPLFRAVSLQENQGREPLFISADALGKRESGEVLSPCVISTFEKRLGLSFDSTNLSNVCLANQEEVLPDFRTAFRAGEILLYVFAGLPGKESGEGKDVEILIPYPPGPDEFWNLVELGRKKREIYLKKRNE